jgi:hypothetical protein
MAGHKRLKKEMACESRMKKRCEWTWRRMTGG